MYDHVPLYTARQDVAFYLKEAQQARGPVLELGCGTGRVLLPIARAGISITGIDSSGEMLARCRAKLAAEPNDVQERVTLVQHDIRDFDLGGRYALITAPFRVLQHMTTIADQLRLLATVARHLQPGGRFEFDVFNPNFSMMMGVDGVEREDTPEQQLPPPDGRRFRRTWRVKRVRWAEQVNETELIYYVGNERYVQAFDMRWFLRAELEHVLARAGFRVREVYGDFAGGPAVDGSPELVVVATAESPSA